MFEREIQYYIIRGAELAEGRNTVALANILTSPLLPQRLRAYFRAEAARLLEEENTYRSSSRFNHSSADIKKLEQKLDELLVQKATFRRDEYLDTLERAVKINFNYLCRPQLTLRSFVFRGEEAVTTGIALQRLAYFDDYPYLTYVLKKWIEKHQHEQHETISAEDFQRTVRKIDDQALQSFTPNDLQTLLQPMFQWIAGAQTTAVENISTDAFIMFFDDKSIVRLSDRLAELQEATPEMNIPGVCSVIEAMLNEDSGGQSYSAESQSSSVDSLSSIPEMLQEEILAMDEEDAEEEEGDRFDAQKNVEESKEKVSEPLQSMQPAVAATSEHVIQFSEMVGEEEYDAEEADEDEPSAEESNITTLDTAPSEIEIIEIENESAGSTEHQDDAVSMIQEIAEETGESSASEEPVATVPESERTPLQQPKAYTPEFQPREGAIPFAQFSDRQSGFKVIGASAAAPVLVDVRSLIGVEARRRFIRKLFRRKDHEYEKALDAINAMRTWKEASSYIDTVFLRNGVDPYAQHAIKFTDIIYGRFIKSPASRGD